MKTKTNNGAWESWRNFFAALVRGSLQDASDDDPSGIGTYGEAGAQFGFGMGWTMLLTFPLMAAKAGKHEVGNGL